MTGLADSNQRSRYRTIVADPPWRMPSGGPWGGPQEHRWDKAKARPSALPYETMTREEISGLPVSHIADDKAHLYLWVPNTHLEYAYGIVRTWGFQPSQMLVWVKTPRGIGLGGAFTNTAEFILFARRGILPATERMDTTWFHLTRPHNNHSAKPEGFLDIVERVSPPPRVELFARRNRLGWDTWGDQALEHVAL